MCPTSTYGNNGVTNSNASDNAHYGIAVVGGTNMRVTGNTASNDVSGVVVSNAATSTSVRNNLIENSSKQGIALRDRGHQHARAGQHDRRRQHRHLRSQRRRQHRPQHDPGCTTHAIALVGATGKSTVQKNTVQGTGYSAIDTSRTTGAVIGVNDLQHWRNIKPFNVVLGAIFQPLTIMWLVIALVLIISAMAMRRTPPARDSATRTRTWLRSVSFTRGIVTPEEAMKSRNARWTTEEKRSRVIDCDEAASPSNDHLGRLGFGTRHRNHVDGNRNELGKLEAPRRAGATSQPSASVGTAPPRRLPRAPRSR